MHRVTFLENGDWEGIILYLFLVVYITFGMRIRHCVSVSGSLLHVGRVGLRGRQQGHSLFDCSHWKTGRLVVWRLR